MLQLFSGPCLECHGVTVSRHLNEVIAQTLTHLREELDLEPLGHSQRDDSGFYLDGQRSKGHFGRDRLTLDLVGDSVVEHHVAHLHEVMHKALNEDTSWGAALQLLDAFEPWSAWAREFRDVSRIVHESFATYMSVLLASSAFPEAWRVLDEYPRYRQLFTRVEGLLSGVAGDHRKYFVCTAVARVCMQSPVLEVLAETFPSTPSLSFCPTVDRPDARFAWILQRGLPELIEVVRSADAELEDRLGVTLDDLDERIVAENDLLDEGWSRWEAVIFDYLAGLLSELGAVVTAPNSHLEGSRRLVDLMHATGADVDVRVAHSSSRQRTDLEDSVSTLSRTRYNLRPDLRRGVVGLVGPSVDISDVVALTQATSTVGGVAELVVHARRAPTIAATFEWDSRSSERIASFGERAAVAVRAVVNESEISDELLVHHAVLGSANDLVCLLDEWGDRGPAAFCASVSSFRDDEFGNQWLAAVSNRLPVVLLLDVGLTSLLGEGSLFPPGAEVHLRELGIGSPVYRGLQWHVNGQAHVGLFLGDNLGVQLVRGQIIDAVGDGLQAADTDWSQWDTTITAVIRSVLATESSIGFDTY